MSQLINDMPTPQPSPGFTIGNIKAGVYVGEDGQSGGIHEAWTDRGLEVNIDFVCDWTDRIAFLQQLRGAASWDGTPGGKVNRLHPILLPTIMNDMCPDLPGLQGFQYLWNRYLCVGTGEFEPDRWQTDDSDGKATGSPGWGFYDEVVIPTRWASTTYFTGTTIIDPYVMGYDLSGYPYTTTTTKTAGEVFSPYTASFKFASSGQPMNEANVGLIRAKTEITIRRHYLPGVDVTSYDGLVGKINSDTIKIGNQTYQPESILYLTYDVEPYGDVSTGTTFCDITHHLIANGLVKDDAGNPQSSWNYFISRKGWDKLVSTTDGRTPYQTAAFKPVIWPDY